MKRWLVLLVALSVTACEYTEVEREIGYKGKARINPWLAAERFTNQYGEEVKSLTSWTAPEYSDALWFVPANVLSNESFTRRMEQWVSDGGHLVLLVEYADSESNDWVTRPQDVRLDPPLLAMLERSGIHLEKEGGVTANSGGGKIDFSSKKFEVEAKSSYSVASGTGKRGLFTSVRSGMGRMTVLTDARIFRNRWIGDKDHAALLDALFRETDRVGSIAFIRGSGVSLWSMLSAHLWPALIGLGVLIALWLWKNFTRFGPIEAVSGPSVMRGYDHHLEALGDFQWRLDRASALLTPLRALIVERGQRLSVSVGRRDDDFFQFLAERSGVPRDRVHRALVEPSPPDSAVLTRTTADLQRLLEVLN